MAVGSASDLRIKVSVINTATKQLDQIQQQVERLSNTMAKSQRGQAMFTRGFSPANLERYGKNLQWTGRQIEYNFTLPLVLAGGAAFKFAMDNEKAMTRVRKVYGDGTLAARLIDDEIGALGRNFEALSNVFGVHRDEVIGVGAAWAQAGASGVQLAKLTRLTMETMVLGELSATEATEGLIAMQAQYGLTVDQLTESIKILNMVENQTGADMQGLIESFTRSAGTAREAGIGIRELAALTAALTPAAGSASRAGNSLKTIISRLMAPTQETREVLQAMGVELNSTAWQSKNAGERIQELVDRSKNLTAAQKSVVASVIASRHQINSFDALIRDLTSDTGYYNKAIQATADPLRVQNQYLNELTAVLASNPQAFKILTTQIQNMMAKAIIPLIPALRSVMAMFVSMAKWFTNLDPRLQKLIISFLALLAVFGPLLRYTGAFILLFARIGDILTFVVGKSLLLGVAFNKLASNMGVRFRKVFSLLGDGFGAAGRGILKVAEGISALIKMSWGLVRVIVGPTWTAFKMLASASAGAFGLIGKGFAGVAGMLPGAAGRAAQGVVSVFSAAGVALRAVWTAWATYFRTILITIQSLNRVVALGGLTVWQAFSVGFTQVFSRMPGVAGRAATAVVGAFSAGFSAFSTYMSTVWNLITLGWQAAASGSISAWGAFRVVMAGIMQAEVALMQTAGAAISTVWSSVSMFVSGIWSKAMAWIVADSVRSVAMQNRIIGVVQAGWAAASGFVTMVWGKAMAWLVADSVRSVAMQNRILGAMKAGWAAVTGFVTTAWSKAMAWLVADSVRSVAMQNRIGTAIAGVWQRTTQIVSVLWMAAGQFITTIWSGLTTYVSTVANLIRLGWTAAATGSISAWGAFRVVMAGIMQAEVALMQTAGTAITTLWSWVALTATVAWQGFASGVSKIWGWLVPLVTRVGAAISAAWSRVQAAMRAATTTTAAFIGRAQAILGTAMTTIWTAITNTMTGVWSAFRAAWAAITASMPVILGVVGTGITAVWGAIAAASAAAWRLASAAITASWVGLGTLAPIIGNLILSGITGPFGFIATAWGKVQRFFQLGFSGMVKSAFAAGKGMLAALVSPWGLIAIAAVAAVVALVTVFRKQFVAGIDWVTKRFNQFPGSIVAVMKAVVSIVKKAALAVYDALSYINPFAHHSPSLVEQVNAGVDLISRKYASLNNVGGAFRRAIGDLAAFKAAVSGTMASAQDRENAAFRVELQKEAPGAVPEFDAMIASTKALQPILDNIAREFAAQEIIVAGLKTQLDDANAALDVAQKEFDRVAAAADRAKGELDAAKDVLDNLAATPIQGMRAMSDAIFDNEMAQKRLRLEIMRLEDAGQSIEDIQSKMAALAGEVETLRGEQADLRSAGAGSDVLAMYDAEIAALQEQQRTLNGSISPIQELQDQLDELARQGERLDLENSLQFDPLNRQIQQLTTNVQELPFDQLLSQIVGQQAEVDRLTQVWQQADAAQQAAQANVDSLTAARDSIAEAYDREKAKLDELGAAYDAVEAQIDAATQAVQSFKSAISSASAATGDGMSPALANFEEAGLGDFRDPGGTAGIGRDSRNNEALDIDKLTKELEEKADAQFKGMDMFGPFKDMFKSAWKWIDENIMPTIQPVIDKLKPVWGPVLDFWNTSIAGGEWRKTLSSAFNEAERVIGNLATKFMNLGKDGPKFKPMDPGQVGPPELAAPDTSIWQDAAAKIKEAWQAVVDWFQGDSFARIMEVLGNVGGFIKDSVWPSIKAFGELFIGVFKKAGEELGPELKKWGDLFQPLVKTIKTVFLAIAGVIAAALVVIMGIWNAVWPLLIHVLKPIFDFVIRIVKAALELLRGIISVVLGVITGDWQLVWDGIVAILKGTWDAIYAVLAGAIGLIIGIVRGLVEGIWNFFVWLYDTLVGHSVIPDMVNAILGWFQTLYDLGKAIFDVLVTAIKIAFEAIATVATWLWENVLKPVWGLIKDAIEKFLIPAFKFLWEMVKTYFELVGTVIKAVWDNVVKPVWDGIKWAAENVLVPVFFAIKEGAKTAWDLLGSAISGVWNNVIKPLWDGIKSFVDTVLNPVWDTIRSSAETAFNTLSTAMGTVWGTMKSTVVNGINAMIGAINTLIGGLKKLGDILDLGVLKNLSTIDPIKLEAGGALGGGGGGQTRALAKGGPLDWAPVGAGFKTDGPKAIVGEGRSAYPEYVIPTDPSYRSRAQMLFQSLGKDIDMFESGGTLGSTIKMLEGGGIVDSVTSTVGDVVGAVDDPVEFIADKLGDMTASAAFAIVQKVANAAIDKVPVPFMRDMGHDAVDKLGDWVKKREEKVMAELGGVPGHLTGDPFSPQGGYGARIEGKASANTLDAASFIRGKWGINDIGIVGARANKSDHPFGKALDAMIHGDLKKGTQIARYFSKNPGQFGTKYVIWYDQINTGGGWRAYTHPSGGSNPTLNHEDHVHVSFLKQGARLDGIDPRFITDLIASAPSEETTQILRRTFSDLPDDAEFGARGRGLINPLSIPKMAHGGTVLPRPGGSIVRLAEQGKGEKVTITPLKDNEGSGKREMHFHGPLSFPNVRSGEDAEAFIRNLERLAEG